MVEMECVLNCGSQECNGDCEAWQKVKSAIDLLRGCVESSLIDTESLLDSLNLDKRIVKYSQTICKKDSTETTQDTKRDFANGMSSVDVMSGYEFEELIKELYIAMGYRVEQTTQTRDGGVDVRAEKGNEIFLIQCKRYSSRSNVGVRVVREFYGTINKISRKARGIIISNTSFTRHAIDFARDSNIQLLDRSKLEKLIETYLGEVPGFRIEIGIQCFSVDETEVYLTLSNTSNKKLLDLQVR